jgi:hypothetical protein
MSGHTGRVIAFSTLGIVVAAALVAGGWWFGRRDVTTPAGSAPATTTTVTAGTTPPPTAPGTGPSMPGTSRRGPGMLADGRRPVYIARIHTGRRTVTVDLIQFHEGEDAIREAAEDGEESPPPDDYYIRNVNPRLRTLPVRAGAPITVNTLAADETGSATRDVRVSLHTLEELLHRHSSPFWITVSNGRVTRIAEQFIP